MNYKISVILPFFYSDTKRIGLDKHFLLLTFDKCLSSVFKSKYNNALLDIALSFSKPEEKQKQIINHVMKEIKEDYINSIKEMINNRYKPFSEIKHKLELKSLNKLTEKLNNEFY